MEIILSPSEITQGSLVGIMRQVQNLMKGRKPRYGAGRDGDWQKAIEGALGEMAVAKYKNVYWSKGNLGDKDVGEYQVRTSSHPKARLILHPYDDDNDKFYSVIGANGKYNIVGWIMALDGKKEEYWEDPTGHGRYAFFVPTNALEKL